MQLTANYIFLDAARLQHHMETAKDLNPNHSSLYKGRSEEDLAQVAPYLFVYEQNSEFANWYRDNGWGDAWGVSVQSASPFEDLYKHFRKFLLVKTEEDQELYFRFYDPRVLRIFLPTCDEQQLKEFFGPVNYYAMEDEDPEFALQFELKDNKLQTDRLPKNEFWKSISSALEKSTGSENLIPEKKNIHQQNKPIKRWNFLVN